MGGALRRIPYNIVMVRYGEIGLKGKNRPDFENRLLQNLRRAIRGHPHEEVYRTWGRIYVRPGEGLVQPIVERVRQVFGISSVSPTIRVERSLDEVERAAFALARLELERRPARDRVTFKVDASRSDKNFPMTSMDLARTLGASLLRELPVLQVDVHRPEIRVGVEVRGDGIYVYTERLPGPGGLPVGCVGKVLALVSGGIDSPVASFLMMKRGCEVSFLTFDSYPFTGERSRDKVVRLVRLLARYQPRTRLAIAPFAEVQKAVKLKTPDPLRTVLYRRMMQRIAEVVARREGARALVTGESLGQVASQTLENILTIQAASPIAVFRPLIGFDKEEIIELAQRIGTYEVSIEPEPDCCTVFQPRHPATRTRPEEMERVEEALEPDRLVETATEKLEVLDLSE